MPASGGPSTCNELSGEIVALVLRRVPPSRPRCPEPRGVSRRKAGLRVAQSQPTVRSESLGEITEHPAQANGQRCRQSLFGG